MKSSLVPGIAVLLTALLQAVAQTPPNLAIQIYAGLSITGAPGGVYVVQSVPDLAQSNAWTSRAFVQLPATNFLWLDTSAPATARRFYRAGLQTPPTNMVFIVPGAFTLGSPTNDFVSSVDEKPQTRVTITRGFWMGKYEVTQGEYLSLMNTNPSYFTNNLNRPVDSVSWVDATNYCAQLTARELAAGRIPLGSRFRLPTEA